MATGRRTPGRSTTAGTEPPSDPDDAAAVKRRLRREMRRLRRGLGDRSARSEAIWRHVRALPEVASARRIMAFASVPGEPEIDRFRADWVADGGEWALPEWGVDPQWPDVVVVPGLGFTRAGDRLGQGGGWYDRFLTGIRSDCVTIGIGFAEQVLDEIPTEPHDVVLDHVVVDTGPVAPRGEPAAP